MSRPGFTGLSSIRRSKVNLAKIVYLAAPYSHPDICIRERRFAFANRAAAELVRQGSHVFSPISHSHPLALQGLPGDWAFWEPFDRRMLQACDELVVLTLDGWRESKGVQAEIDLAIEMDLPIRYLAPEELGVSSPTLAHVAKEVGA